MTIDDRDLEAATGRAPDAARPRASPRTCSWRSVWPTAMPASTPPSARSSWPGTGSASRSSRRRRTTRRSRRRTWPGPGDRAHPVERVPAAASREGHRPASRRRPAGHDRPRPARPHRLRTRRLAQGPRDPRGEVRPYGWIAAEIGRPKAVRAVGTALGHNPVPLIVPCHRVVRTDGTIGQYSLGGPENKRTILAAEGLDLPKMERLAASGVRYIGSDTTQIVCLPTCRHARRVTDRHRVEFHSIGRRPGARVPRLPGVPSRIGCDWPPEVRLYPGPTRAGKTRFVTDFATGRRNRWVPTLRLPWTTRLCQSRNRRPERSRARRSGSGCSSCTWSGGRPTSGSPSRSTRSRRSSWPRTRFFLAGVILLAWSIVREGRTFVLPSRRELRDSVIVGSLLLGGGNGLVAFGEQTVPSGIAALLVGMMPVWVAILGRIFLGERLPRLAIDRHRDRVRRRRHPRRSVRIRGQRVARSDGARREPPRPDRVGGRFAVRLTARLLPGRPLVATGIQMVLGGRSSR